jgi:hypothetical protein
MSSVPVSDVQLSPLPASAPTPTLSASQIATCVSSIKTAVEGKTLSQVLTSLPGVVESTYVLVQSFLGANSASISSVVLTIVESGLGMSGLPAADIAVVDQLLGSLVPSLITLVGKYVPEVEQEVESGCSSCCEWLKSKFKC